MTLDDRDDRTLLDGGRALEAIGGKTLEVIGNTTKQSVPVSVDATKKFGLEIHVVEAISKKIRQQFQGLRRGWKY